MECDYGRTPGAHGLGYFDQHMDIVHREMLCEWEVKDDQRPPK